MITGNLCRSLCKFVHAYASEDRRHDEKPERSPKTASFDHRRYAKSTGNLCVVIIIIIICKFICNIIYIATNITGIPVYRVSLCYQNHDISGGGHIA